MRKRYKIGLIIVILSGLGMAVVWGVSSSGVSVSVRQEAGVDVVKLNDVSLPLPSPPTERVKVSVENDIWKVIPPEGIDKVVLTVSYHDWDRLTNRPLFLFALSGGGVDSEVYLSPTTGQRTLSLQPENTFYVTLGDVSWSPRPSTDPVPVTLVLTCGQDSESATVTIPPYQNKPPEADFSYTPSSPTPSDAVKFTDESSDPDGTITSRYWDFGDSSTGSGENPVHLYSSPGTYTVTLEVSDDDGVTDTVSEDVTVGAANEPPVANAGGPYSVEPTTGSLGKIEVTDGGEFKIGDDDPNDSDLDDNIFLLQADDGSGASSEIKITPREWKEGDELLKFDFQVQNGSPIGRVKMKAAHDEETYDLGAAYSAEGLTTPSYDRPPQHGVSYIMFLYVLGNTVELDGTGSCDPDGSITSYSWEIIDDPTTAAYLTDSNSTTPIFHAPCPKEETDVTVQLTVTDGRGSTSADIATVTVQLSSSPSKP